MNINRDNYEEYFLLYIDKELSLQERIAVAEFVIQNPDLKTELEMLQDSILIADGIVYENRGSLLNNEHAGEGIQEKLLLLLDGELNEEHAAAIKTSINEDAEISKEWELLKQTKLAASEQIIFRDKAILYKKGKGKLIPMGWRVAAAAILIGFGLWSTVTYFNRTNGSSGTDGFATQKRPASQPVKEVINSSDTKLDRKDTTVGSAIAIGAKKPSPNKLNSTGASNNGSNKLQLHAPEKVLIKDDLVTKDAASKTNNLPVPSLQKINKYNGNNVNVASVPSLNKKELKALDNPGINEAAQPYAINTAFTDNKDEKITYGFEEEEDQPKKTKVGGFLKKLNRVLQRNANIKTGSGDSFKVANLSFAVQ